MFADPAEPGVARKSLFENWRAVHKNAMAKFAVEVAYPSRQTSQPSAQNLVIVAAQCVPRYESPVAVTQHTPGVPCLRLVIHPHANYRNCLGHEVSWPRAAPAVTFHVAHLTVAAQFQPALEIFLVLDQVDAGNPNRLEAEFLSPVPDSG